VVAERQVPLHPLDDFSLADLEMVRNLLRGGSVIDWHRLALTTPDEVRRLLRVQELDLDDPRARARVEQIKQAALEFLQRTYDFPAPPDVAAADPVQLFLMASTGGRRQKAACIVLKVMHVIHHLAGRELLTKAPISDQEIFDLVEGKALRVFDEIRRAGLPVVEFSWGRKQRDAQILKLLAKRDTLAASLYDKLRFRLITATRQDIVPVMRELCHRLIPFNYVVPGQSLNQLVPFRKLLEETSLSRYRDDLQAELDAEEKAVKGDNEFSGPTYRVINFVADLPVRLDRVLARTDALYDQLGPVVFVLAEFQVVDRATAEDNDRGENSHDRYKQRQTQRVFSRLTRGLTTRPPT
jgi:uncharacterized protein (TIGR04552 family)